MPSFNGKIKDGIFMPYAEKYMKEKLSKWNGKEVTAEIVLRKNKRSNEHNRYYWLILKYISIVTGIPRNKLHEMFKAKYLSREDMLMGETVKYYVSTTKLTAHEMFVYIERIKAEMAEFGYPIPVEGEITSVIELYE